MKKGFERKTIFLKNSKKEEYFIDKKSKYIAITKRDKKIYVNEKFLKLPEEEKEIIIFHERGHSKFRLWKIFLEVAGSSQIVSYILIAFSLIFIIINILVDINLFNISNLMWLFFIFLGILFFILFVSINWLLEIVADSNSIKFNNKNKVIETIERIYKNKKPSFWNDKIMHPPWKIRKKIMEELD